MCRGERSYDILLQQTTGQLPLEIALHGFALDSWKFLYTINLKRRAHYE